MSENVAPSATSEIHTTETPEPTGKLSQRDDMDFATAPNLLTMFRVLLVPVVVWLLFQRRPSTDLIASFVFGFAAITDYFDGYLARKMKSESVFGKLMDPLADKFLVVSCLVMLQELGRIHPVVVMLLICREMAITGLRALASSEGLIIGASNSAKWKTAIQMFALPFLMVEEPKLGIPFFKAGQALIYLSLAFSLWTAKDYVVDFFRAIAQKRRELRMKKKELRALKKLRKATAKL
jgi:CDP-diacylglycerol--glycerol-3-phosphate 3-phosphatidyltransferase